MDWNTTVMGVACDMQQPGLLQAVCVLVNALQEGACACVALGGGGQEFDAKSPDFSAGVQR